MPSCALLLLRQTGHFIYFRTYTKHTKWPHPLMPKGRPIVLDCDSETYNRCSFIDHFLQPLATRHSAYIKDTYDFITKVRGTEIPSTAFLVTGDVTALYTSMDITRSIECVRKIFDEYPSDVRPDDFSYWRLP